ncbi:T9SS type A sorting domain-containing protein [candidate division KSB1 bacterium]|nr:T9SS type A sorting domain-containing protein [candidate division KSB1 bacterium]
MDNERILGPQFYSLSQYYPNPLNPQTTVRYDLPAAGFVKLTVFDIYGQVVRTLVEGTKPAGSHKVVWDGRNRYGNKVSSGVYFYSIHCGDLTQGVTDFGN